MSASAKPRAWQRMLSGRRLDLIDPSPLDVEIADIAHGLARVARWNGQTRGPEIFSVAQHSLLVEAIFAAASPQAARGERLAALLHDAPEYVIGDMISPFKAAIGGDYKIVENRLLHAIFLRYGLPPEMTPDLAKAVKAADRARRLHRRRGAKILRRAQACAEGLRRLSPTASAGRGAGAFPQTLRRARRRAADAPVRRPSRGKRPCRASTSARSR
jgi:hypothetical protein